MKKLILLLIVVSSYSAIAQETTTFILIRHAEKLADGTRNPSLSMDGAVRVARLMEHLELADITHIYSTNYIRTMKTVAPIAQERELEIQTYGWDDPQGFLQKIFEENSGGTVIISGHSNTTPILGNLLLGEERLEQFDEKDYSNLLIITATELGNGKLLHMRF